MGVDAARGGATRVAKVIVDVVLALSILGAVGVTWSIVGPEFFRGKLGSPSVIILIPVLLSIAGLCWLRAFLRDVNAGQVFTVLNARRLARIGWLLIAVAIVRAAAPLLLGGVMSFYTPMMILPMLFAVVANTWLVSGLLLLVIAAAWRYGTELQAERDLTV